jgi:hypothetical protein
MTLTNLLFFLLSKSLSKLSGGHGASDSTFSIIGYPGPGRGRHGDSAVTAGLTGKTCRILRLVDHGFANRELE